MAAQLYSEFLVCKSPLPPQGTGNPEPGQGSLLGGDTVVTVFENSTSKNDDAPFRWNIGFLGMEADFTDYYVPAMGAFFDDGVARSGGCGVSGSGSFVALMRKLYRTAPGLTISHLEQMDLISYSWSEAQWKKGDCSSGCAFQMYGELRYGYDLWSEGDLERFIRDSLLIQVTNDDRALASATERVFAGRPWFHSRESMGDMIKKYRMQRAG